MKLITLVIPCYNELESLPTLISKIQNSNNNMPQSGDNKFTFDGGSLNVEKIRVRAANKIRQLDLQIKKLESEKRSFLQVIEK